MPSNRPSPMAWYRIAGQGFSDIFVDLGSLHRRRWADHEPREDLQGGGGIHAQTVFILPNNGNITLAAQQAAEMSDKQVIVIPTKNVAMGIAAVVAFQSDYTPEQNEQRMNEAAERVRTGTITYAVRDTDIEDMHIKEGSIIGLNNGRVTSTAILCRILRCACCTTLWPMTWADHRVLRRKHQARCHSTGRADCGALPQLRCGGSLGRAAAVLLPAVG